jgi:hypothetical protein
MKTIKDFTLPFKRRHRTYCSTLCANNDPKIKEKIGAAVKAVKLNETPPKTIEEIRVRKEKLRKEKTSEWNRKNNYQK